MKTIAFFNNKGGVAKTTSVINVAYILAEVMHKSVMIIDCDGQQNASRFFTDVIPEYGIEEALLNTMTTLLSAFSHTRYENIDIVCSTQKMNDCSKEFEQLTSEIQQMNLNKIKQFSSDYDYVLLDLPPALNCLTEKILGITDSVIVPVELGTFAIQGVSDFDFVPSIRQGI